MKYVSFRSKVSVIATVFFSVPFVAAAQAQPEPFENLIELANGIGRIVGILIPVVFSLALLFFFWGVVKYIASAGNEDAQAQGRRIMVGGIIALFVISSVWGLVRYIQDALGISAVGDIAPPSIIIPPPAQ